MKEHTQRYSLSFPEVYLGEVMGKLNVMGILPENDFANTDGIMSFHTDIPVNELFSFIEWFRVTTKETGEIELST